VVGDGWRDAGVEGRGRIRWEGWREGTWWRWVFGVVDVRGRSWRHRWRMGWEARIR